MKLLVLTQKIDINDDVLGFMRGWVAELAKHCEKITVIALGVGEHKLPDNVKILSLGKERGASRLKYLANFYKHIWRERKKYDAVFVHMNKEYVLLGGALWKLWGKKVYLWYNHKKGNILSDIGGYLSDMIFFTSPFSYFSKHRKAEIMPVGVNTDIFFQDESAKKISNSILCLGRISPVKNIEFLIEAAKILKDQNRRFAIDIIGSPTDDDYYGKLKKTVDDYGLNMDISFRGGVANLKAPAEYNRREIFVNLTNSGSMDKTVFEAMSCGLIVLASNRSFEKIFPKEFLPSLMFKENNGKDLAEKIAQALVMPDELKKKYQAWARNYVIEKHSLEKLAKMVMNYIK